MEDLPQGFSPSLRFFIEISDVQTATWLQFFTIIILTAIVYQLGFAKKLSLLKNIIVYTCLVCGCLILLVLSYLLPMVEGLAVAALLLIVYKVRLRQEKKQADVGDM